MSTLSAIVILFIVSFAFYLFIKKLSTANTFLHELSYSGIGYIAIGFLLGPKILGVFNASLLEQLDIFIFLILGWAGFLVGLQTQLKGLRRFSVEYYSYSISFFVLSALMAFVLLYYSTAFLKIELGMNYIIFLSIVNACTSPILIALMSKKLKGQLSFLLRFNSAFDNVIAVILYGILIVYFLQRAHEGSIGMALLSFLIVCVATFAAVLVYRVLDKQVSDNYENQLYVVGLLLVIIGLSYYMHQSIILFSFIFGVVLSNMKINTKKIYLSIDELQKPLYILLLFIVGAQIEYSLNTLFLTIVFIAVHIFSKWASGYFTNRLFWKGKAIDNHIGLANLGMGGIALAFFLELSYLDDSAITQMMLFLLAISIIISDIISNRYLKQLQTK